MKLSTQVLYMKILDATNDVLKEQGTDIDQCSSEEFAEAARIAKKRIMEEAEENERLTCMENLQRFRSQRLHLFTKESA